MSSKVAVFDREART